MRCVAKGGMKKNVLKCTKERNVNKLECMLRCLG